MNLQERKATREPHYNRACDACRYHKVRCLPQNPPTSKTCERCARTDRQCIFAMPQKRKPRKSTDTRVAELEREIQAMRALLEGNSGMAAATQQILQGGDVRYDEEASSTPMSKMDFYTSVTSKNRQEGNGFSTVTNTRSSSPHANYVNPHEMDVIDRGIISELEANQLFSIYVNELVPNCPTVVFPPGTTADGLRREKPILFLAVLAAAAGQLDSSLQSRLSSEVLSVYTDRTVFKSEKSLELVQTLIVQTTWNCTAGDFAKLKFYEQIHASASMAMDIGLGTNLEVKRGRKDEQTNDIPLIDQSLNSIQEDLERRRVFLTCYLMTIGVAINMRRPAMLRSNGWISDCVDVLSTSPLRFPSDESLCQWVRLAIITEDIYTSFSHDDKHNSADLSEIRVQLMMKNFEKRLEHWKAELTPQSPSYLWLAYYHYNMFAHEIAIHDEHLPEELRPPFRLSPLLSLKNGNKLSTVHVNSIAVIISSAHSMINTLLAMNIDGLRALPILVFARLGYACVILTKLYASCRTPESPIATIIDVKSLKLYFYLTELVARLAEVVGHVEGRAPSIFHGLLTRLREWYIIQEKDDSAIRTGTPGFDDSLTFVAAYPDGNHIFMTGQNTAGVSNLMTDTSIPEDYQNHNLDPNTTNSSITFDSTPNPSSSAMYLPGQVPMTPDDQQYLGPHNLMDMDFLDSLNSNQYLEDLGAFDYDANVWTANTNLSSYK